MNHASLFSGIGGFDLAAREVGWNNVFQCEIDPFCQSVLKYGDMGMIKVERVDDDKDNDI